MARTRSCPADERRWEQGQRLVGAREEGVPINRVLRRAVGRGSHCGVVVGTGWNRLSYGEGEFYAEGKVEEEEREGIRSRRL